MSIWEYSEGLKHDSAAYTGFKDLCVYCSTRLVRDYGDESKVTMYEELNYGWSDGFLTRAKAKIGVCPACGWWCYFVETQCPDFNGQRIRPHVELRRGILRSLDLSDVKIPISVVRDFLTANYDARFSVHPKVFEDVVGSVFKDHGYDVRVTGCAGDDGIDVILDHACGDTIGIQVKRYKDRISVAQIRELTGALVIGGYTRGVFVTTSDFQSGCARTARLSESNGKPIELVNSSRFYEALRIAQFASPRHVFDAKPWGRVREWPP